MSGRSLLHAPHWSSTTWRLLGLGHLTGMLIALHMPLPQTGMPGPDHVDKIFHVTAYAVLAWLCVAVLATGSADPSRVRLWQPPYRRWLWALMLLGLADELTQPLTGRTASIWDYLCDLMGICAGMASGSRTVFAAPRPDNHV